MRTYIFWISIIATMALGLVVASRSNATNIVTSATGAAADGTSAGCIVTSFTAPASQWVSSMSSGCAIGTTQPTITDINGTTTITHIGKALNQSVTVGTLALGTKTVTVTGLTGLLAGDVCTASPAAAASLTVGLILAGCQSTTNGQAILTFATPIAIGISVGSLSVNIAWIG